MQARRVQENGVYATRIAGELVTVRVIGDGPPTASGRATFCVERTDNGRRLPKCRTASSLHEVRGAAKGKRGTSAKPAKRSLIETHRGVRFFVGHFVKTKEWGFTIEGETYPNKFSSYDKARSAAIRVIDAMQGD